MARRAVRSNSVKRGRKPAKPAPFRLFCSDLDGTLLGNAEATRRFTRVWDGVPHERRPVLVYASGRLVEDVRQVVLTSGVKAPDWIIGGVGTQLHDWHNEVDVEPSPADRRGWNLETIMSVLGTFEWLRPQPAKYLTEFKSSWYLPNAKPVQLARIRRALGDAGLDVNVVYSSHRDLDVVPHWATKGGALRRLCERLRIPLESVLVAGDTGNDISMFTLPGVRGIIPDNALPELLVATVPLPTYTSPENLADGVLDGLRHFGVVDEIPAAVDTRTAPERMEPSFRMLFSGTRLGILGDDDRALLRAAYEQAVSAIRRNITPLGFSACSIADNTVQGTAVNYHSVWARDGAITILGTLELTDAEIRDAARQTLHTLLRATNETGLVPASVRVRDGVAEFSGVGNIAAIDGALWVVIAAHAYFAATGDTEFLEEHLPCLRQIMVWLKAHDSNNDGMIEIPEAGDWTDLFGRSYDVLYDEVLWFRANICFGRLLESANDASGAAAHLQSSQRIRERVLEVFWPTTSRARPDLFTQRQASLGDTQYLLAEVTPFSFSWRCDVLANILAFLMNLLDVERARQAFHFMWGVGVNRPWPVANLYPVVQAGDPDWRAYYTVNLLNLPNHYHNGGIWPFIGGFWVRFIHRLGLHDVACNELVQLAKANRLGRVHEWEFNEWLHGGTGRPMGRTFQAWSAASFVWACHELEADPTNLRVDD